MSTQLQWTPNEHHRYSIHAGEYSICAIGGAGGWTYEVWEGREQLKVGLHSADEAKAWCQRHHDETQRERSNVDDRQASLLAGQ